MPIHGHSPLVLSRYHDIVTYSHKDSKLFPQESMSLPQDTNSFLQVSKSLTQDNKFFKQVSKSLYQVDPMT